jgi:hypothetical protein
VAGCSLANRPAGSGGPGYRPAAGAPEPELTGLELDVPGLGAPGLASGLGLAVPGLDASGLGVGPGLSAP